MSVGFVKSIAAMLVGTGFAMPQPPAPAGGQAPGRATIPAAVSSSQPGDVSYPQTATQLGYAGPLPAETSHGLAVPDGGFGGVSFDPPGPHGYRVYADAEFLLWNVRNPNLPSLVSTVPVGVIPVTQTD